MTPFFEEQVFPVGTRFLLADGRRFSTPDIPNQLSRSVWLYRVVPDEAPQTLYQLRVRLPDGVPPLQEALPPGLDWEPIAVTGILVQGTEYRLPPGCSFLLAYDIDANHPEEPDWDDKERFPPLEEGDPEEETAEDLLEEMLTDIKLCITLLNLELKWMRGDKTVEVAKLAETMEQLHRMTRMKEEYEQALARQEKIAEAMRTAAPPSNLILFPGRGE